MRVTKSIRFPSGLFKHVPYKLLAYKYSLLRSRSSLCCSQGRLVEVGEMARCLSPFMFMVFMCLLMGGSKAQLSVGYYLLSCPLVELIVKGELRDAIARDRGVAAGLIRLHFHDCFVRGCDGSILIDSTPENKAEKDSPANGFTLRGLEVIDRIKEKLESLCPGVVSCADILAFAARESVEAAGGIGYVVPAGRMDGRISKASETVDLPSPRSNLAQLTQAFAKKGLTQEEMVTLSGAHSIGRSHCGPLNTRLYNFSSTITQDPTLDPFYATQLKQQCPKGSTNQNQVLPMDPISPTFMDSAYYKNILANRGLFISDQTLLSDPITALQLVVNANGNLIWKLKFASAMVKMGQIGVLVGDEGEIRSKCRVINNID